MCLFEAFVIRCFECRCQECIQSVLAIIHFSPLSPPPFLYSRSHRIEWMFLSPFLFASSSMSAHHIISHNIRSVQKFNLFFGQITCLFLIMPWTFLCINFPYWSAHPVFCWYFHPSKKYTLLGMFRGKFYEFIVFECGSYMVCSENTERVPNRIMPQYRGHKKYEKHLRQIIFNSKRFMRILTC